MNENRGICRSCSRLRRLAEGGAVEVHHYSLKVSRRAITSIGAGQVRRRCPGSGQPPRRVSR